MKHKIYTIERGIFWIDGDKCFIECKNQPSFLDIDKANDELDLYLRECSLFFNENKKYQDYCCYIELYINEEELDDDEIKQIEEFCDYPDGTSLTAPIKAIYIDNSYNFNPFRGYDWGNK